MPLPLLAVAGISAVGGFLKSGGLGGILGGGKRKQELVEAEAEQKRRQREFEDFDYNQDVGYIHNPHAEAGKEQYELATERADENAANLLQAQQQGGNFGGAQAILAAQNTQAQNAAQNLAEVRSVGAQYVEQQRQSRIQDKLGQAETFLGRADNRLAAAEKAKAQAKQALIKGIGGGLSAAAGAVVGGTGGDLSKEGFKNFDSKKAFSGSGLFDSKIFQDPTAAPSLDIANLSPEQIEALKKQLNQ